MKKKTDVFYFRLTPEQRSRLEVLSGFYHCNNAQFLRMMIDAWYELHIKLVNKHIDKK